MSGSGLEVDGAAEAKKIAGFIRDVVKRASAGGAVLGLSGGVDSAVTGALCVKALGKERVVGLLMPSDHTPVGDTDDAKRVAESWGIRTEEVPISGIVEALVRAVKVDGGRLARANAEARARMAVLYYHSNSLGYVVAGTGDRSEIALGYFTKFGDGGADLLPIAHLYKTQVRQLGKHLGLPEAVVSKPSSPQLWPGHRATDEIPADYAVLDVVLRLVLDEKMPPQEAAKTAGVPAGVAERAMEMHRRSEHKRALPPSLL